MKDLIVLQNCHVTQVTNNGQKGKWKVRENITSNDLFELSEKFTDEDVNNILSFAKTYEQIAFESGISFQKKLSAKMYEDKIKELTRFIQIAREENNRLATKLEKFILSEE
jgi:hypothetical protein